MPKSTNANIISTTNETPPEPEVINKVLDISKLKKHPENYRFHGTEQLLELRASLRKHRGAKNSTGQVRSIVVQDDGDGTYTVVAGHGITEALELEGEKWAKCDIIPTYWTPQMVKSYLVADNYLSAQAKDDLAVLTGLVTEQAEIYGNLDGLGINHADLDTMIAELKEQEQKQEEFDKAPTSEPIIKRVNPDQQIRPVLYVSQLEIFERALRKTGNPNRGEALIQICSEYLGEDLGTRREERQ